MSPQTNSGVTQTVQIGKGPGFYSTIIPARKHPLKCTTCGKFLSILQTVWYNPIPGMMRQPYHVTCDKP